MTPTAKVALPTSVIPALVAGTPLSTASAGCGAPARQGVSPSAESEFPATRAGMTSGLGGMEARAPTPSPPLPPPAVMLTAQPQHDGIHMSKMIWGAALSSAFAALALAGSAHAAELKFTPGACAGDYSGVASKIECGTLTVDETRGGPSTRRVSLPVTIVKASAPKPGAVPLVYLHGGPGGGLVEGVGRLLRGVNGRELVAGRPGLDLLRPARRRRAAAPARLRDPGPQRRRPAQRRRGQQAIACAQRLKESGVDLSRYNAEEVVKDIQDLRKTLGLKQIDLMGVSYGTRIALAVVKHDPTGVRAVVLISPWTPEAKWAEGGPEMVLGRGEGDLQALRRRRRLQRQVSASGRRPRRRGDQAAGCARGPEWPDLYRRPLGRLPDGRGL